MCKVPLKALQQHDVDHNHRLCEEDSSLHQSFSILYLGRGCAHVKPASRHQHRLFEPQTVAHHLYNILGLVFQNTIKSSTQYAKIK